MEVEEVLRNRFASCEGCSKDGFITDERNGRHVFGFVDELGRDLVCEVEDDRVIVICSNCLRFYCLDDIQRHQSECKGEVWNG